MEIFLKILFLVLAYVIGSIPNGYLLGKIKGHNLLKEGSGNIGATNAGRVLGKPYAFLTYFLDMLKGAILVFLFRFNIIPSSYCVLNPIVYGVLAILGHTFSCFLKFKGGKSVGCGSGVIVGYMPYMLPVLLLIFFIFKKISSLVSLSSLISSVFAFLIVLAISLITRQFLIYPEKLANGLYPINYIVLIGIFIMVLIIYVRHLPNIKRILKKEELPSHY